MFQLLNLKGVLLKILCLHNFDLLVCLHLHLLTCKFLFGHEASVNVTSVEFT